MSAINTSPCATYSIQKTSEGNLILMRNDFDRIKSLGIELYKFWGHTALTRLCAGNFTHFNQIILNIKNQMINIRVLIRKREYFAENENDRARWEKFFVISAEFTSASSSGDLQKVIAWTEKYKLAFLDLQKNPTLEKISAQFLELEKNFALRKALVDLTGKVKFLYKRIAVLSELVFNPKINPPNPERREFIALIVASVFPYYSRYRDNPEQNQKELEALDPGSKNWKGQIHAANEFGKNFNEPQLGHDFEKIFFQALDNQDFPVATEIFQKTPVVNSQIIEESDVANSSEKPSPPPPAKKAAASHNTVQTPPPLHPTIQALSLGFRELPIYNRVERWHKASFDVPPDPKIFPKYDLAEWGKALARHRIPFYLLLNLQDQLADYGTFKNNSWKFSVTLELPDQKSIQGYADVSKRDGAVYHNYFMADKENDAIRLVIDRMKKYSPIDTFYNQSFITVINDFHFKIMEDNSICIEDTCHGIRASIHPLKKLMQI